jgi:hypothetical protein
LTFHDQLRATFRLGSGVLLGSALLFVAMYAANRTGYTMLGDSIFGVALGLLGLAALTMVAGLVGRSAHRWVWFNVITRSSRLIFGRTASQRMLDSPASPILRLWLHIDPHGKDKDCLISPRVVKNPATSSTK